jgi:hypothetical protein
MKPNELMNIVESFLYDEVKKNILNEGEEVYHIKCEGQLVDTFKSKEEAESHLDIYKKDHPGKQFIIEKGMYESYDEMIDKLDEMGGELEEKENINMKHQEPMEGNAFVAALNKAKESGEDTFTVDGEEYDVKESWQSLEEEEMMNYEKEMGEGEDCMECGKMEEEEISEEEYFGITNKTSEKSLKESLRRNLLELHPSHVEGDDFSDLECAKCQGAGVDSTGHECKGCGGTGMETPHIEDMGDDDFDDDELFEVDLDHEGNVDEMNNMDKETCNECGGGMMEGMCMECGSMMKESKKKIRVTESELVNIIKGMVKESVRGLQVTQKAQKGSKKDNDEYIKSVGDKMKKAASFDNNDNPEFPKQIGKGEKATVQRTSEEEEFISDNRGGGLQDLRYEFEPSDKFKDRLKKALEGHSTMGNSQDGANVVKSDLGKNMVKNVERKEKKRKEAPMYNKDAQPVKVVKESENKVPGVLLEEMSKMKHLLSYNKKTQ